MMHSSAIDWLCREHRMPAEQAYMLCSVCGAGMACMCGREGHDEEIVVSGVNLGMIEAIETGDDG